MVGPGLQEALRLVASSGLFSKEPHLMTSFNPSDFPEASPPNTITMMSA